MLPNSRKEGPSFFPENVFSPLSVINVRRPHPAGPPTPPPVGSPPTPDIGQSRGRIVIEPASVPEAATKPALRHAGLYSARLVAWIPFLGNAPRARKVRGHDCFLPFGWRRQDQKDKAPRCRSKDGDGHEILLAGLYRRTGGLAQRG